MGDQSGLQTQTDHEITDAMREKVGQLPAIRESRSTKAKPTLDAPAAPGGVAYEKLKERNPEWLGEFWRGCRALYAGGPRLLKDEPLMTALFPKHANEAPEIYKDRSSRAFYIAYAGEIIDHLIAGFAQDPIRLSAGVDEKTTAEKELPKWWAEFSDDVSPPGGTKQKLGSFAIDCLREMFVTQSAWVLIDMPKRDKTAPPPASRLEEETAGLLDPYLCLMPTDNVVDWQVDDDTGELEWVLCYWRTKRRDSIRSSRGAITERWMFWTAEGWEKYEHTFDPAHPPAKETVVPLADSGKHPFKVVPFVRLQVPEGLYAMGKLESLAREHFNKRCAGSWAEYKALFAVLYEFMAAPTNANFTPITGIGGDAGRAVNQVRGQGYSQLRGEKDRAEYIGPDIAPFKESRESCAEIMREMHRVMFSMALSANMDSAALQRSGESKDKDAKAIAVILVKVGELMREGIDVILDLVAKVRSEERGVSATGGEKFDADSVAAAITEAVELLNGVPMRSPTFMQRYLFRLYKLALGPSASDEDLQAIQEELETVITAEALLAADAAPPGPGGAADDGAGDDPADDEGDDTPPPAKKPSSKPRRLFPAT